MLRPDTLGFADNQISGANGQLMPKRAHLPFGWRIVQLGDVAIVETGGTPSRAQPEYWGGNIPWMSSGEINQRRVSATAERITQIGLENSNAKVFPTGTAMVAMNGQGATRGKVAELRIEAACNQSLAAVQGRGADCRFLFHRLDSSYELLRSLTGGGRSGLNLRIIRSFRFLLPPLAEQRAIAAVLDSIDAAIERTDRVIAATEQLRGSLSHEILTRGVPGWHTRWVEVPGTGTVPVGWARMRLGDVAKVVRGISWSRDQESSAPLADTVPVVRIGNVQRDGFRMNDTLYIRGVPEANKSRCAISQRTLVMVGSNGNRGPSGQRLPS